ncbi:hypothetical protein L3V83_04115 [Thiotrichales bacterium 19X7-9]|nr:hypothetical protein [Thiotrichales bacterium 19X7-9]TNF69512.1 MAG: hypothetical protein EP298_03225 [Gammaproteobacteria bacterium]UTW43562.1 hypothetical protein KFE69_05590 [bacterium SCSIO 12844]
MSFKDDVVRYWGSFHNPVLNNLLTNIEHIEGKRYGDVINFETDLEEIAKSYYNCSFNEDNGRNLISLCNEMPLAYMAYFIHQLHKHNANYFGELFGYMEANKSDGAVTFFAERNRLFERAQMLSRVFSQERLEAVNEALEEVI